MQYVAAPLDDDGLVPHLTSRTPGGDVVQGARDDSTTSASRACCAPRRGRPDRMHHVTSAERPSDDPASRLLSRSMLVLLIGGFAVFTVPRAGIGLASGEPDRQVAAVVGLAFWGWLTWRLVVLIKDNDVAKDGRYWLVSAAGFGVFALVYVVFEVIDATRGDFDARSVPFTIMVLGLAVTSASAGRRVRGTDQSAARPGSS
jgi:hypothetical protein